MTASGPATQEAAGLLSLARQHHQAGRLGEAKQGCQKVLASDPRNVEAAFLLALILGQEGRAEAAAALLRQAVEFQPNFPSAYRMLAKILAGRGDAAGAIDCYREGLGHSPDSVELEGDLANMLLNMGRLDEAIALYRRVAERVPGLALVHNNLGIALDRKGLLELSLQAFDRALELRPDYAEAYCNRANALANGGRHSEAIASYRRALELKPDLAEAYSNLGNSLIEIGRAHEAVAACRRAVDINPRMASGHGNLGIACMLLGENEEARLALAKAIALAPRRVKYHYHLGEVSRHAVGSPEMMALVQLENQGGLSLHDHVLVHFALAKIHDDAGKYEDAWRHLQAGNALHRRSLRYDPAVELSQIERIRRQFTADFVRRSEGAGNLSDVPAFIIGMPRSGTTLVEQILSSHPRVFGAGELPDFRISAREVSAGRGANASYPESVATLEAAGFAAIGTRYLDKIRRLAPAAGKITDKLPDNFLYVGLIHLALPNAPIIHVVRDPADTCLSCFSKLFQQAHLYSYDLAELGRYYRQYQRLMVHWQQVLPPGRILEVRYEDLVRDTEAEARRMVAHCGLEWDPACLAHWQNKRAVYTASHAQVRQPMFDRSIGRWRNYERFLGPLLAELNAINETG